MGQKIKPTSIRIGIIKDWNARWYPKKNNFKDFLEEDETIRKTVNEKIAAAGIDNLSIERYGDSIRVFIKAARPGVIIGRGGKGIEDLSKLLEKKINKLRTERKAKKLSGISLNIEEIKRMDISAAVVAQTIAKDLERRLPFRRLMKKQIENAMQNRDVKGIKIKLGGRLNGAEIARSEMLAKGTIPLQTIRANIDYAEGTAFTTYGTIGIKVWINKGEIFSRDINNKPQEEQRPPRTRQGERQPRR